jgi:hypothetical protein
MSRVRAIMQEFEVSAASFTYWVVKVEDELPNEKNERHEVLRAVGGWAES